MTIFVAGHKGMVGRAIVRASTKANPDIAIRTAEKSELDLMYQTAVMTFFKKHHIDEVYLAAAKVGGIHANNEYPAQFIYENLMIQANVIHAAHMTGVQKLLFLGSSCIYPKLADQPMQEAALLSGALEPTNEPYAIAKIAGIKLCESYNRQYGRDYRSVMPTNLYGSHDNFHPENSHVIPAMMRRFHEATQARAAFVTIWGTGGPKREFLHVDDMAAACLHVMTLNRSTYQSFTRPMLSHVNVGSGVDYSIKAVAEILAKVTGFLGELRFDVSKPDGAPRKLLDVSRLRDLGWESSVELEAGLAATYEWYKENVEAVRRT